MLSHTTDEELLRMTQANDQKAFAALVYRYNVRLFKIVNARIRSEDDAQNGPDHVDAHRSPAFIAGGFVKRGFVDHTMYLTSSVLRTMELILGMPPMTQYDAAATPMWRSFNNRADTSLITGPTQALLK